MKTFLKIAAAAALTLAAMSCKEAPKYTLTDGQWVLIAWSDAEGVEQMVVENRPTLRFDAEGRISGNAGCNRFSGQYRAEEEVIQIDLGAMTRKFCLDMTLENRTVEQMPLVDRYVIEGNQLTLYAGETELFRYDNQVIEEAAPAEEPAAEEAPATTEVILEEIADDEPTVEAL